MGAVFAGGLLGSAHCIGMCGGFAATIGAARRSFRPAITRQLVYSMGRLCTYMFLGAVGGTAGLYLARFQTPLIGVQQAFAVLAGVIMLGVGLSTLGVFRKLRRMRPGCAAKSACAGSPAAAGFVPSLFGQFLSAPGMQGVFVAGLATGFLPCGLVYSFLAMAVASGSLGTGMLIMACFGLGTVPAMVLIGCGSSLLSHAARMQVYRVAACLVIVLGVVTVARAFPNDGGHCHAQIAGAPTDAAACH